jgi:type I restriction enzyme S subunit
MSSKHWPIRPLGDCAKFLSGGTPRKDRTEFWEGDIPWVSSGEMTENRIHDASLHITAEAVEAGSRLVPENTVLAVVRGMSLAKEFRVSITKREVAFNQDLKAFACKPDVDPEFLFYSLFAQREHIRRLATEASHGTKKLETDTLAGVSIPLPELRIQRRTAEVASIYDELIENNQRRMQLLENAGRLLYDEWFVRLRFPGYEHTPIADGVPEGWLKCSVGQFGQVITGKTPSTKDIDNYGGEIPFIKTPDMHGNMFVIETETSLTEKGANTQPGKFIPPNTVLVSCIGTIGVVSLSSVRSQFNQQINALVPSDSTYCYFCFFAFRDLKGAMEAIGGGVTMSNINKTKFKRLELLKPPAPLLREFHEYSQPLFQQIQVLAVQNQKLRIARDLFLPRLMSGELLSDPSAPS